MDDITFTTAVSALHGDGLHPLRMAWRLRAQAEGLSPSRGCRPACWRNLALLGTAASVLALLLAGAGPVHADDGVGSERIDRAALAFRGLHFAQAYAGSARQADARDASAGPALLGLPAASMLANGDAGRRAEDRPHPLGPHPAIVVQRLQATAGYDYASKLYPHPAWLYLRAAPPPDEAVLRVTAGRTSDTPVRVGDTAQ